METQHTKTTTTAKNWTAGDLCVSAVHGCYVRFVRWTVDGLAVVMDRNTLSELPDLVHPAQLS